MPGPERNPQTLYDKVLSNHIVDEKLDGTILLYIGMSCTVLRFSATTADFFLLRLDRHLVHEVTSPVCWLRCGAHDAEYRSRC